ncbi:MAG: asparagine synthase (glutamine-hydrolyzing) [Acidobacteriota bacterium]|nr:MAG: asparagine synthase (glutamine-hydrolyzing) [Acidobacteriota bacterium]
MCGIFGIVTSRSQAEIREAVVRAVGSLSHRGPDDEGIEFIEAGDLRVAFGHRRLSILDLSAAAHQPMFDRGAGNLITYNGEVFNFREVRRELEARGLRFESESDTEVILKGYGLLGERAIESWRGMFAFGFWDAAKRRLTLVRDRLGIKPLYYFHDGETFIFASEVRSLLATGLIERRLSGAALDGYLSFGSIQQPLTAIEKIYEVLPGHSLVFENGRVSSRPYWELRAGAEDGSKVGEEAVLESVREVLEESVRLRLVSDVPVGAFLSGGIDSSAVVSMMRRATNGEIRTFSVCFREEEFSERRYAERVAERYGTSHRSVLVTGEEILSSLPKALGAMDQPSIDGINTWVVSEATARAGLKVAVSGLGGDELFAGYGYFRTIARDEYLRAQVSHVPAGLRRAAAVTISAVTAGHRAGKLSALLRGEQLDRHAVHLHRRLFTREQRDRLLRRDRPADLQMLDGWSQRQLGNCATADPVNQASALELGGYMSNTLLRDTDSMSMSHGLEVRVPLIDHRVVERMLELPGRIKLRPGTPKWLLVGAAGDLPDEIVHRPKRGFELPFKVWLAGPLRDRVTEAIESARMNELFRKEALLDLQRGFEQGRVTWSRLWSVVVLDEWLRVNLWH